jgi:hypothetical protein
LDGGSDGLAGEEVVAEVDRAIRPHGRAMLGEPPLGRVALAVLLLRAILRDHELRRERQNLVMAGCHDAGAEKAMEVLGAAIRAPPRGAGGAMDFARGEVLAAIECHQQPPAQMLKRLQPAALAQSGQRDVERLVERRGIGAVQHHSDVVVAGDCRHAEQRLAIRAPMTLGQTALMRQERRASHEKHRERREADIGHRVHALLPRSLPPVRKTRADLAQIRDQALQRAHTSVES